LGLLPRRDDLLDRGLGGLLVERPGGEVEVLGPAKALPPAAPAPAVPAASAIVPYAARRPVQRTEGGFDFFGTQKAAIEAVQDTDLADVVGEEVLEEARAAAARPALAPEAPAQAEAQALTTVPASAAVQAQAPAAAREDEPVVVRPSATGPIGQVIDLTAHDETEQLDLAQLRDAVNQ
ncbi:hypothetical protein ABT117_26445, partial [Streptomyces sp. NPDC002262]